MPSPSPIPEAARQAAGARLWERLLAPPTGDKTPPREPTPLPRPGDDRRDPEPDPEQDEAA